MLQASRDAIGLNLNNAVVVVDEAHNLVDAIGNAHSAPVSLSQLQASENQLSAYLTHFRQRLSSSENQLYTLHVTLQWLPGKACHCIDLAMSIAYRTAKRYLHGSGTHVQCCVMAQPRWCSMKRQNALLQTLGDCM